jgi:hypothetical protein
VNKTEAEEFTESLTKVGAGLAHAADGWWRQRAQAVRLGIPAQLGMTREQWLGQVDAVVQLPRPERREAVRELTEEGLNNRQIAAVLGVNEGTVRNDRKASENSAPEPPPTEVDQPLPDAESENSAPEPEPIPVPTPTKADQAALKRQQQERLAAEVRRIDELIIANRSTPYAPEVAAGRMTWEKAAARARQWKTEYEESVQRDIDRVQAISDGWGVVREMCWVHPEQPHSTAVLCALMDIDRQRINEMREWIITNFDQIKNAKEL